MPVAMLGLIPLQAPCHLELSKTAPATMRLSILTTLFTYIFFGIVHIVSATPVIPTTEMVVKRSNADISGVSAKLKSSLVVPLGGIDNLIATKSTNQENVEPLIKEITAALDTAASELAALQSSSSRKRQSDDEVAQLITEIITSLANTLSGLLDFAVTIPLLGGLLAGVDTSLNQVLLGLSILLQGVLRLVVNLLISVAQLLRNLALGLSLGTLGL
ncbi:hypothetical protein B0J17DRAFT_634298 [Rhizoctonia solani]|nr:hypothetical protein B0J17DRAFT_634298 [Rhizoctonia solani]